MQTIRLVELVFIPSVESKNGRILLSELRRSYSLKGNSYEPTAVRSVMGERLLTPGQYDQQAVMFGSGERHRIAERCDEVPPVKALWVSPVFHTATATSVRNFGKAADYDRCYSIVERDLSGRRSAGSCIDNTNPLAGAR
jgi:hypothetical protein